MINKSFPNYKKYVVSSRVISHDHGPNRAQRRNDKWFKEHAHQIQKQNDRHSAQYDAKLARQAKVNRRVDRAVKRREEREKSF